MDERNLGNEIYQKIKPLFSDSRKAIPLHEPLLCGNEWNYVQQALKSGMVSSIGSFVDQFEADLKLATGVKHVVATINGTAALHICFLVAGVQPEDEVLTSPLSFIATTNAIAYCQAIPHFVDIETTSLSIDPDKLRVYLQENTSCHHGLCINKYTGRIIRALCAVHVFGHPADLDRIQKICQEFNLVLVEDAAEALGSYYKNEHVGQRGIASALSFNGNKIITTGAGGAILTNDDEIAKLARHLTTQAKLPHQWKYEHDMLGYNYRMANINAALGCAQLENLPYFLTEKRKLAHYYADILSQIPGICFHREPTYAQSNYWLNAFILNEEHANVLDDFLELTHENGIFNRPIWELHHRLPMYNQCPRMDLSVAESLQSRIINIPSGVTVQEKLSNANKESSHYHRITC